MMQANEQVNQWLAELGEQTQADLTLDQNGRCSLSAGDDVDLDLFCAPAHDNFFLSLPLMSLADQNSRLLLMEHALNVNLFQQETNGAAIALDPESHDLLLCYAHPLDGTDFGAFYNILGNMIETGRALKNRLTAFNREATVEPVSNQVAGRHEGYAHPVGMGSTQSLAGGYSPSHDHVGAGAPAYPQQSENPHEHLLHFMNMA